MLALFGIKSHSRQMLTAITQFSNYRDATPLRPLLPNFEREPHYFKKILSCLSDRRQWRDTEWYDHKNKHYTFYATLLLVYLGSLSEKVGDEIISEILLYPYEFINDFASLMLLAENFPDHKNALMSALLSDTQTFKNKLLTVEFHISLSTPAHLEICGFTFSPLTPANVLILLIRQFPTHQLALKKMLHDELPALLNTFTTPEGTAWFNSIVKKFPDHDEENACQHLLENISQFITPCDLSDSARSLLFSLFPHSEEAITEKLRLIGCQFHSYELTNALNQTMSGGRHSPRYYLNSDNRTPSAVGPK